MERRSLALALTILTCLGPTPSEGSELPAGFVETIQLAGVPELIDFDWDPDGGLWAASKLGQVWVRRDSASLAATLHVDTAGDSGIAALVIDPDHASNRYVWIYYAKTGTPVMNRLSRFTNVNDVLQDETVVFETPRNSNGYNGGCLGFFEDETLYLAIGFDGSPPTAQDPFSPRGSLLRMTREGDTPEDNPFADGVQGNPLVYAYGLRQPFRCSRQPGTGNLYIGDVGSNTYEEINLLAAAANFGYPLAEGAADPPIAGLADPFFWWPHLGLNSAVILGDFAPPLQFFPDYDGDFFVADHNRQRIYRMKLDESGDIITFSLLATNAAWPVSLKFGPDGALYYAAWWHGQIRRIEYVGLSAAGGAVDGLMISKQPSPAGTLVLHWNPSCNTNDTGYAVFEGLIPAFDLVQPRECDTPSNASYSMTPGQPSAFYLVVPHDGLWQGSFGKDSQGVERIVGESLCFQPSSTGCN